MSNFIKEIPLYERPRERLKIHGCNSISNKELLEIIISSGTKNISVSDLADNILKNVKDIKELKNMTLNSLKKIKGIKDAKAIKLLAAIELGKRVYSDNENVKQIKIKKSSDVFKYFYHLYQNKMQEELMVILLNTKNIVIDYKFVFKGSLNHSIVHPREIFKEAIYSSANAIIIIHNHPSGDVTPSEEDKKITEKIVLCGEMLNMPLLDHIIFGNNAYYSFLEEGNIWKK